MRRDIFRKVALDRIESPEQLDQLLRLSPPANWLALLGLAIVLAAALGWAALGSLRIEVTGPAALVQAQESWRVVLFLPPASASTTRPGMPVRFASTLGGAALNGVVAPTNHSANDGITELVANGALAQTLGANAGDVPVYVDLLPATDVPPAGTRGEATVLLGEQRPFSLLFSSP